MPTKEAQGYTYKILLNGEWQDVTIAESPIELVEKFEQSEEWARVVRCKECKHYGTSIGGVECQGYCKKTEFITKKDNDFCSWGERKQ